MNTLKPRKYYNLSYSVMPDNKIRQVVGTYTERSYSEIVDTREILEVDDMRNGAANPQALPPFSNADLASSSTFTGVFKRLDVYGDGFGDPEGSRLEKIVVKVTTDIYNDEPMTYISANTSEGAGIERTRTANQGTQWTTSIGWVKDFDAAYDRVYAIRNYNASGGYPSTKTEQGLSDQQLSIEATAIDPVYDGTRLLGGKYLLRVTHSVVVFESDFECYITYDRSDPGNPKVSSVAGHVSFRQFSKFKLNITYGAWTTKEIDFDHHTEDADYAQYPLRIAGNEYTNVGTKYSGTDWHQWIANQLLDKYRNGKIFINAKVKASYLIENQLDINSEVLIKDIDNQFIRRNDMLCVFQLKNIEYVYSGSEFVANVVFLETRIVHPAIGARICIYLDGVETKVVSSNNLRLVLGDNPIILEDEEEA